MQFQLIIYFITTLSILKKFARYACVEPVNRILKVKHERNPVVKTEEDIQNTPFEVSEIYCGQQNSSSHLDVQIAKLNEEKTELIEEMIVAKTQNQKLIVDIKNKEQIIAAHMTEQRRLINELSQKEKAFFQLSRENGSLQAKIKQLMASASAHNVIINHAPEESPEEEKDVYEVEDIVDHKYKKGQRLFLIRWKGFSPEEDTWEKESNLNCAQILIKYLKNKGL